MRMSSLRVMKCVRVRGRMCESLRKFVNVRMGLSGRRERESD